MAAAHHECTSFMVGKRGCWEACAAGLLVACRYALPPYSARTTDSTSLRTSSGCCKLLPESWPDVSSAQSPAHVIAHYHETGMSWADVLVQLLSGCSAANTSSQSSDRPAHNAPKV